MAPAADATVVAGGGQVDAPGRPTGDAGRPGSLRENQLRVADQGADRWEPTIAGYRSQAITCDRRCRDDQMAVLTREYRHATERQVGGSRRPHPQAD